MGGHGHDGGLRRTECRGKAVFIKDSLTPGVLHLRINNEGAVQRTIDNGAAAVGIIYGVAVTGLWAQFNSDGFWRGSG